MAQVYLARDVRLGRDVAVKVLDKKLAERPGFRERFMREARLAAALDHPNIVPLYDFGDENALFLVMPYLSGGSLQDLLPRTPLPPGDVVTYGSQIADALDYAHQRKVVHRDVKPANMLLHADRRLMLSDFGLAKIVGQTNTPNAPRNRPDAGTPEYMAPEQVVGSSDARSDIYGLGVVLYLLLTGRLPFTGSSSNEVMQRHVREEPVAPRIYNPNIPPAMESVVLRAMAKSPDDRYQRAGELGAALLGALIASHVSDAGAMSSPSSYGISLPTGPTAIIPPAGQARQSNAAPWARRSSGAAERPSPLFGAGGSAPAIASVPHVGSWEEARPASSISGMLPNLDRPFTSLDVPEPPGEQHGRLPSTDSGRSGQWGSFSGAPSMGGAMQPQSYISPVSGRIVSAPTERPASFPTASRTGEAHMFQRTMAPVTSRPPHPDDIVDPRAALPGSRMTDPPEDKRPPLRSSRLWIAIAILLLIMLVAAITLLHYFQMDPTAPLR